MVKLRLPWLVRSKMIGKARGVVAPVWQELCDKTGQSPANTVMLITGGFLFYPPLP